MDDIDDMTSQALNRSRFAAQWGTIGAANDDAFDMLVERYAEPHRAYHNAFHISECLAWSSVFGDQAHRHAELELAIYFHDAVYDPAAGDNEARSAELFLLHAEFAGVRQDAAVRIIDLIKSTAHHSSDEGDAALLSDIDLSILGAPPFRYAQFEAAIRLEYSVYDDATYRAGRVAVLRGFLDRAVIYRTAGLKQTLEGQARENLSRALAAHGWPHDLTEL